MSRVLAGKYHLKRIFFRFQYSRVVFGTTNGGMLVLETKPLEYSVADSNCLRKRCIYFIQTTIEVHIALALQSS